MRKTGLEGIVEHMIALKRITSPTGVISDRAKRKLENYAQESYIRLKERQKVSDTSVVNVNMEWKDEQRAKGIALGIREFSKKYPEYGQILREIIEKHHAVRRAYIEFGLNHENDLPKEFYIEVIMELGNEFTRTKSEKLYCALSEFWDRVGRVKEKGKYDILLPE